MKKNIVVVYGGDSDEWIISEKSAATVFENLNESLYNKYLARLNSKEWFVEYDGQKIEIDRKDFSFEIEGERVKPDGAFIVIHGTPGEDGKLQGYFDMIKLPYNTCSQLVSTITFNKGITTKLLRQHGFNCANSVVIRKNEQWSIDEISSEISVPCFVKPNGGGSSFGISKVSKAEELLPAIERAFEVDSEVIIEDMINGRELTNAAYQTEGKIITMPVTEIISHNDFFDFEAKYEGDSEEVTPAEIDHATTQSIQSLTESIYRKMDLRGLIRVDYMLSGNDPYIIEINTTPGLSAESLVPQQVGVMGLSLQKVFDQVVNEMTYDSLDK